MKIFWNLWDFAYFCILIGYKIVETLKCVYFIFVIYFCWLLYIFPPCSFKSVKIVYHSWRILLIVFLCVTVMHMSVLMHHNTTEWISWTFSDLFRRMFVILRKAVAQSNKSNLKKSSNIECTLTNNTSYRFKNINILLHVGPWLYSLFLYIWLCFKVMLVFLFPCSPGWWQTFAETCRRPYICR